MGASAPEHVLVVGAGLGGIRTVEGLRAAGYEGRISLVGGEKHLPYDRPPLSKQFLAGDWERGRIDLLAAEAVQDLGVRTHLGRRAVALRPGEVDLADGSTLHADAIVLAPGVTSRTLAGQPASAYMLRDVDDSLALKEVLATVGSLLVVGAGFIGAEVASTALGRGVQVTVLEAAPVPMARVLGEQVGALAARLMAESGVTVRCGVTIESLTERGTERSAGGTSIGTERSAGGTSIGTERSAGGTSIGTERSAGGTSIGTGPGVTAALADGSTVSADAVVVGVGGRLDLDWLADTGLDLTGGIPCDERGRVLGLEGVWAVGDAAAWADPRFGDRPRHEHWTSATDQAAVVARDIVGLELPPETVPYFWSDQFGLKIQLIGRPDVADAILPLHGEGLDGGAIKGTTVGYLRGDELVAVVGFGAARRIARYRAPLSGRADRAAVLAFRDSLG